MFKPVLLTLAIIGVFPCGAIAQSLVPTIVVDEVHQRIPGLSWHPAYTIPAASGLIVDPGSYTFPARSNFKGVGPNAIWLAAGAHRNYKAVWHEPPDRTILDATTLEPLPGSEPFRGFAAGDHLMVSIGIDRPEYVKASHGSYRNYLDALWTGLVLVK
jgi:hypothetical protein